MGASGASLLVLFRSSQLAHLRNMAPFSQLHVNLHMEFVILSSYRGKALTFRFAKVCVCTSSSMSYNPGYRMPAVA